MKNRRMLVAIGFIVFMSVWTSADQTRTLSRVMREKLGHSQAILAAVITSNWTQLDRESRALALATRDPAWVAALSEMEYLRESDAFSQALQELIEASARRDLEVAGNKYLALTATCVRCHLHVTRRRMAR